MQKPIYCLLVTLLLTTTFSQVEELLVSSIEEVLYSILSKQDAPSFLGNPEEIPNMHQDEDPQNYMSSRQLGNAQWISPKDSKGLQRFSKDEWVLFATRFGTECPQSPETISIKVLPWNYMVVVLNGKVLISGYGSKISDISSAKNCQECNQKPGCSCGLNCVCNTLDVYVWSGCDNCSIGVKIGVTQDKTGCHVCSNKGSVYNYETCRCECKGACQTCFSLKNEQKSSCGCVVRATVCPSNKWFNHQTCQCECKQRYCCSTRAGQWRNPNTCECLLPQEIQPPASCSESKCWNNIQPSPLDCGCPANPNNDPTPACAKAVCPPPLPWNRDTCSCASN